MPPTICWRLSTIERLWTATIWRLSSDYHTHAGVAPLAGLRPSCVPGLCRIAGWSGLFKLAKRETLCGRARNGTERAVGALLTRRKESIREKRKRNTAHFRGIYGGLLILVFCCAVQGRVKLLFRPCAAFSAGGNAGGPAKRKAAWNAPDGPCDYLFFRAQ